MWNIRYCGFEVSIRGRVSVFGDDDRHWFYLWGSCCTLCRVGFRCFFWHKQSEFKHEFLFSENPSESFTLKSVLRLLQVNENVSCLKLQSCQSSATHEFRSHMIGRQGHCMCEKLNKLSFKLFRLDCSLGPPNRLILFVSVHFPSASKRHYLHNLSQKSLQIPRAPRRYSSLNHFLQVSVEVNPILSLLVCLWKAFKDKIQVVFLYLLHLFALQKIFRVRGLISLDFSTLHQGGYHPTHGESGPEGRFLLPSAGSESPTAEPVELHHRDMWFVGWIQSRLNVGH